MDLENLPIDRTLWYSIGNELGLKDHRLREIKLNNRNHPEFHKACTREMFILWLRSAEYTPSYQKLVQALSAAGLQDVALSLCEKYGMLEGFSA